MSSSSSSSSSSTNNNNNSPLTYWCYECDMSIHLLLPNNNNHNPVCPQCQLDFLELMDPNPNHDHDHDHDHDHTDFLLLLLDFPHKPDPTEDDDDLLFSSSSSSSSAHYHSLLPTVKIPPLQEEEELDQLPCAVCKDAFTPNEEVKRLPCLHLFHPACILPWLSSGHPSCPLCRANVSNHHHQDSSCSFASPTASR